MTTEPDTTDDDDIDDIDDNDGAALGSGGGAPFRRLDPRVPGDLC